MNGGWIERGTMAAKHRPRVTWAAVALSALGCLVQLVDFYRSDMKPLLELTRQNQAALVRIERRLDDHERRIAELENGSSRQVSLGVSKRVKR